MAVASATVWMRWTNLIHHLFPLCHDPLHVGCVHIKGHILPNSLNDKIMVEPHVLSGNTPYPNGIVKPNHLLTSLVPSDNLTRLQQLPHPLYHHM